jgi:hypothetical protein
MNKIALPYGYDEFNYCDISNNFLSHNRKRGEEYYTYAGYNFLVLFESFDKILIDGKNNLSCGHLRSWYDNNNITYRADFDEDKTHVYKRNFTYINKTIQKKGFGTNKPLEYDYTLIKNKLEKIDKPIVVISARNINNPVTGFRNNLLEDYIAKILQNDAYVINLTIEKPNLNFSDNYEEVSTTTYSEMLSYFMLSNCVVCLGNAGGVSTHLKCSANFFIVNNHETWVGCPATCLYNGETILSYRMKNNSVNTYSRDNRKKEIDREDIDWILNQKKPDVLNHFFDTNKIIHL